MPFQPTKRRKSIPQPDVFCPGTLGCDARRNTTMRNRKIYKLLINNVFIVDCKSAYAGSIPTSASTLENPVD